MIHQASGHLHAHTVHTHPVAAWSFVALFAATITVIAADHARKARRPAEKGEPAAKPADNADAVTTRKRTVYDSTQPVAKTVKAILQMAVGLIAVTTVGWQYIDAAGNREPTRLFLDGVGAGLAVAAALELAYTLFTDGPDEALDPLMLGLAAAIMLQLANLPDPVSLSHAAALALLGLLLAGLFATRLILAERTEDDAPRIWWIRGAGPGRQGKLSPPIPGQRNAPAVEEGDAGPQTAYRDAPAHEDA